MTGIFGWLFNVKFSDALSLRTKVLSFDKVPYRHIRGCEFVRQAAVANDKGLW